MIYPNLKSFIATLSVDHISEERKTVLQPLADFLKEKGVNDMRNINFICTHNSRRSHLAQVWAQTMAAHFGVPNVHCYSGGTEVTRVYSAVIETLKHVGFKIEILSEGNNPIYSIRFNDNSQPIIGFSKKYEHAYNPVSGFAAVMTCSQADGNCPFIAGTAKRISITFEDPKVYDNTPEQMDKYGERSEQIATEMFYIFSQLKA